MRAGAPTAGFTTMELLVAGTTGLLVTGAALALVHAGNRSVATLATLQSEWHHARAAASLWAAEWRGAGYDPTGASGAGLVRFAPETLEFSSDWNGDGALLPTSSNPNERLAWAAVPGAWKRGVNGGPRLVMARPESIRFVFRDGELREVTGGSPGPVVLVEIEVRLPGRRPGAGHTVVWSAARRVSP